MRINLLHIITLINLLLFVSSGKAKAQTSIPKAQAMFLYNFSRLVEWPTNYRSGPFIIASLGATPVADELKTYTSGKKVGTQEIQIITYKTIQDITDCHILFIPFGKTKQMAEIIAAVQNKSILIITEKTGALKEGAGINFILLSDKIKFEINGDNITKYGLKYSAKLQEMANTSQ
jgi:hypothetical protein